MVPVTSNNTTIEVQPGGVTRVVLYNTCIVEFSKDTIHLRTNGYRTHTTKRRINEIAEHYNLGFLVYAVDYQWYVATKYWTRAFTEEPFTINRKELLSNEQSTAGTTQAKDGT